MVWKMTQKKRRRQPRVPGGTRRGGQYAALADPPAGKRGVCAIGPCNVRDPNAPTFWEQMRRRLGW